MSKKFRVVGVVGREFYKEKMYDLIRAKRQTSKFIDQTTAYDRILKRVLKVFQLPELIRQLECTEMEMYNRYILPLIRGDKRFPFQTGIFFASLVAIIATYDNDFWEDTIWGKLADNTSADDWIDKIGEYETELINYYLEGEYKHYRKAKENEDNKARKIRDIHLRDKKMSEIKAKYSDNEQSFKEKLWARKERLWARLGKEYQYGIISFNLRSICFKLTMINFHAHDNSLHQDKLEWALYELKCLPLDRKEQVFSQIRDSIDCIYNVVYQHMGDWKEQLKKSQPENDPEWQEYCILKYGHIDTTN